MITLSINMKGLALLHQVEEMYGKVYTSDSLLEKVLYWGINCTFVEIDHEIISTVILLPSADSFKKGCCQLQAKVCAQITG